MLAVTGPLAGGGRLERLAADPAVGAMGRQDFLVSLGGSGVFAPRTPRGRNAQLILKTLPCSVLFLDGADDDYDRIADYPEFPWNGGMTNDVWRGLTRLCRGQVFTMWGKTFAVMGGAATPGRDDVGKYWTWWPDQDPSERDIDRAVSNLEKHGNRVDWVFTCECPSSWKSEVGGTPLSAASDACEKILETCSYGHWYFADGGPDEEFPELHATRVKEKVLRLL
jgi:hypothetical protein